MPQRLFLLIDWKRTELALFQCWITIIQPDRNLIFIVFLFISNASTILQHCPPLYVSTCILVYTAILMEAPPRFSRPLWSEDRMNIRQVAVLRLTFTPESSELDFAVRFAFGPDQLIHLQLVDMSGEVHLQKSFMLGSSSWDNKVRHYFVPKVE